MSIQSHVCLDIFHVDQDPNPPLTGWYVHGTTCTDIYCYWYITDVADFIHRVQSYDPLVHKRIAISGRIALEVSIDECHITDFFDKKI